MILLFSSLAEADIMKRLCSVFFRHVNVSGIGKIIATVYYIVNDNERRLGYKSHKSSE